MKCPHCNKYLKIEIKLDDDQEFRKTMDEITAWNIAAQANWMYQLGLFDALKHLLYNATILKLKIQIYIQSL